jgi:hypothetical protein
MAHNTCARTDAATHRIIVERLNGAPLISNLFACARK